MEVADRFYLLDTGEEGQLEEGFEYSPPDKAIAVRENIAIKFMYSLSHYFSKDFRICIYIQSRKEFKICIYI